MKAIVIEEECHGDIKVCTDMRSAFEYLLTQEWLPQDSLSIPERLDELMAEYNKNSDFLDGNFYFHEIDIFKGER